RTPAFVAAAGSARQQRSFRWQPTESDRENCRIVRQTGRADERKSAETAQFQRQQEQRLQYRQCAGDGEACAKEPLSATQPQSQHTDPQVAAGCRPKSSPFPTGRSSEAPDRCLRQNAPSPEKPRPASRTGPTHPGSPGVEAAAPADRAL